MAININVTGNSIKNQPNLGLMPMKVSCPKRPYAVGIHVSAMRATRVNPMAARFTHGNGIKSEEFRFEFLIVGDFCFFSFFLDSGVLERDLRLVVALDGDGVEF